MSGKRRPGGAAGASHGGVHAGGAGDDGVGKGVEVSTCRCAGRRQEATTQDGARRSDGRGEG